MWHPFPGFSGVILGPVIIAGVWATSYFTKEFESYNLDPKGVPGSFEPLLGKYIRAAEFIIGLATGSIVLLVGSSALHKGDGCRGSMLRLYSCSDGVSSSAWVLSFG
jgi:hypothetical protein